MRHASEELIAAMKGERVPAPDLKSMPEGAMDPACGDFGRSVVLGDEGRGTEDLDPADCPACLVLMREAMDPVRWDALESRGLASLGVP